MLDKGKWYFQVEASITLIDGDNYVTYFIRMAGLENRDVIWTLTYSFPMYLVVINRERGEKNVGS